MISLTLYLNEKLSAKGTPVPASCDAGHDYTKAGCPVTFFPVLVSQKPQLNTFLRASQNHKDLVNQTIGGGSVDDLADQEEDHSPQAFDLDSLRHAGVP